MQVLVVGAGAVGSFLGWAVAAGGGATTLVRRGLHAPARETLVAVRPDGGRVAVDVELVPAPAASGTSPDLVIVAVKQYDVASAVAALEGLHEVPVLTVQNGIGAEETVAAARPGTEVLGGSVTASVERRPDGSVGWLRTGGLGLGPVQGDTRAVADGLRARLRAAGLPTKTFDRAAPMKWSKLVANLVANATSGLLDLDPPAIYADPGLFEIERRQLAEALDVMRAIRLPVVALPGANVPLLARAIQLPSPIARFALRRVVGGARGGKDPSLRAAVDGGGRTEVAWLNGAVASAGAKHGVATPVNDALTALVTDAAADPDRRAWFRRRPDRLVDALRPR
jgi:2-dehydropantoate 2-reductase